MKSQSNKINASSLFHFTRKFDTLQSIVRNGLRFSYAFERFSPNIIANFNYPSNPQLALSIYQNTGVAIPMISFCDIPITRTAEHIGKYGQYMIGLDKEFIIDTYKEIINPVLYIHSNNLGDVFNEISNVYSEAYNKQIEQVLDYSDKTDIVKDDKEWRLMLKPLMDRKILTRYIMGLLKPYYDYEKKVCYYDEREWRVFWPDGLNKDANWIWGISFYDYKELRTEWNKKLSLDDTNYLTIPAGFLYHGITHIVVKGDDQVQKMIDFIMKSKTIFGQKNVSTEERLCLISKITSFERIEKDY